MVTDHVAIMKKEWGLLEKILSGKKTVESRWAKNKPPYWGKVSVDDRIFFKNSGAPVTIEAKISDVQYYPICGGVKDVEELLRSIAEKDGIEEKDIPSFVERFAERRYAMVVGFQSPHTVDSFQIDKTGYGNMAAWLIYPSGVPRS